MAGPKIRVSDKQVLQTKKKNVDPEQVKKRYGITLDNLLEGCQIIGFDWRYLYLNKTAARHSHNTEENLLGHTVMEMYPGIEDTKVFTLLCECIENRTPCRIENEFTFSDGSKEWFDLRIQPASEGVCIFSIDITESKRLEQENKNLSLSLQQEKEKLNTLMNIIPHEVLFVDTQKKFVFSNTLALSQYGYNNINGIDVKTITRSLDVYRPDGTPSPVEETPPLRALRGEIVRNQEEIIQILGGELRYRQVSATPIKDASGNIVGSVSVVRDITEQRRGEKKSQAIIQTALDGFFLVNMQGQFLETNSSCCQILGYTREELLKMVIPDVEAGMDAEEITRELNKVKEQGYDRFETLHRCKDGTLINAEISANYLHLGEDLIFVFIRDITERKKAEEALKESETRYRYVVELSKDGICIVQDGLVKYCNPQMAEMWGGTIEEIKDTPFINYLHPDKISEVVDRYNRRMAGEHPPSRYESVLKHKNGGNIFVEFNVGKLEYLDHETEIVVIHDITEHKKAEALLQDAHRRLSNILEGTSAGTWEWNIQTGETVFNEKWAQTIGYTLDELAPISIKVWEKYTHPDDLKQSYELLERHFAGELSYYDCECRMKHKDGHWIWVHDRGQVFTRTSDGKPLMMFGTHVDITERKKAEKQKDLSIQVLQMLHHSGEKKELIRRLLELFKTDGLFEAVGIRLQDGDNFPYYENNGFTDEHIRAENQLCSIGDKRNRLADDEGYTILKCMCGNVIRGRYDPSKPYFTRGGSFWTNSITDLLASMTGADIQMAGCDRCHEEGYESVALIPLKANNNTIGLLQINDTRRNCFTPELIKYYEDLARSIGIALAQKQIEESLQSSETKYRDLYQNAPVAYFSVSVDGLIKESNRASQVLFGYSKEELTGKHRLELYSPEYHEKARMLFEKLKSGVSIKDEEMVYQKKGGGKVYGLLSSTPVIDENGHVITIRNVIKDNTENKNATEEIKKSHDHLQKTLFEITQSFAATVELRDPYTAGHQKRVAELASLIAREIGLSEENVQQVYVAGLLHDIGKLSVPSEILSKPGELNEIEFALLKMHPLASYEVIRNIDFSYPLSRWILEHHERLDGSGYPAGLTGDKISLEAKILAVADVVEAMSSHRPYRASLGMEEALNEINHNKNKLYDVEVVNACSRLINEKKFDFKGDNS